MKRLISVYIALIPGSIREWVYDDTIKLRQFVKKIKDENLPDLYKTMWVVIVRLIHDLYTNPPVPQSVVSMLPLIILHTYLLQ